jgi:TonB family protein
MLRYLLPALVVGTVSQARTKQGPNPCGPAFVGAPDTTVYFKDQVATMPVVIRGPELHYPDAQRKSGVQGRVVLGLIVNAKGKAEGSSVRVLQSLEPSLDREAVRYIRRATLQPGCRDGRPVRVQTTIPVEFKLAVIIPGAA